MNSCLKWANAKKKKKKKQSITQHCVLRRVTTKGLCCLMWDTAEIFLPLSWCFVIPIHPFPHPRYLTAPHPPPNTKPLPPDITSCSQSICRGSITHACMGKHTSSRRQTRPFFSEPASIDAIPRLVCGFQHHTSGCVDCKRECQWLKSMNFRQPVGNYGGTCLCGSAPTSTEGRALPIESSATFPSSPWVFPDRTPLRVLPRPTMAELKSCWAHNPREWGFSPAQLIKISRPRLCSKDTELHQLLCHSNWTEPYQYTSPSHAREAAEIPCHNQASQGCQETPKSHKSFIASHPFGLPCLQNWPLPECTHKGIVNSSVEWEYG